MNTDLFGPLVFGDDVERAVIDTLKLWLPGTYLPEVAERAGYAELPDIRSYRVWPEAAPERWAEDQLPVVAIASPGTRGEPRHEGDGEYSASWELAVGVIVSARTEAETGRLAKVYSAAIRMVLLQHSSLGGVAAGVTWLEESYTEPIDAEDRRSLAAGISGFEVEVRGTVNDTIGPAEPTPPIDGSWPQEISEVDVDVQPKES